MKVSIVRWGLVPCFALFVSATAYATPFTVDFTYTGAGQYISGETATGSGSFTVNGQTLTAFSFTDTLSQGGQTETYTYDLGDVTSAAISAGDTNLGNLVIQIQTEALAGTPNPFGKSAFDLAYSAADPGAGSTGGAAGSAYQASTFGSVNLTAGTAVAATPEPSSLVLLGTGVLACAGAVRRRFFAA